MFAQGEFLLGERDAMSVPQSALVLRDGFQHVFEMGAGNHVVLRRVQTGQRVGTSVGIAMITAVAYAVIASHGWAVGTATGLAVVVAVVLVSLAVALRDMRHRAQQDAVA